jgi:Nucleotidyl transferase AbiEii toxin, Type IV TA system
MTTAAYQQIISAPPRDRLDLFLATANRLGTPIGNVEKDFWVCWTLNALYHERPATGPRLLFKGGTSLSKAYGLIERFSEDIDVTVFRDDLDEAVSLEDLEALSNKKRRARLDAIRDACRAYITGPLYTFLGAQVADATSGAGRMQIDQADPDGQMLLLWYPEVEPRDGAYIRPVVRIESGAKSALDPNQPVRITPYIADDAPDLNLSIANVTTIEAGRTLWDKVVIAQACGDGMNGAASFGRRASACRGIITICIACFSRTLDAPPLPNPPSASIACGTRACSLIDRITIWRQRSPDRFIAPIHGMIEALIRDYDNTKAMVFGSPPEFTDILASVGAIERIVNEKLSTRG